jgi:hypothetical protein
VIGLSFREPSPIGLLPEFAEPEGEPSGLLPEFEEPIPTGLLPEFEEPFPTGGFAEPIPIGLLPEFAEPSPIGGFAEFADPDVNGIGGFAEEPSPISFSARVSSASTVPNTPFVDFELQAVRTAEPDPTWSGGLPVYAGVDRRLGPLLRRVGVA